VCEGIRAAHGIDHVTVQAEAPSSPVYYQPLSEIGRKRR
jgi:hypothetical protein